MGKINLTRVFLGGIAAGGFSVALQCLALFLGAYQKLGEAAGLPPGNPSVAAQLTLAVAEVLVGGPAAIWFYAAIRPRFGAGPRTAIFTALWIWLILGPYEQTVIMAWGLAKPLPLGAVAALDIAALPAIAAAVVIGASLYKEEGAPASSRAAAG